MWELVVLAAQNPALHWTVIIAVFLAYAARVLMSAQGPLMSDMYHDELDS